MRRLLMLLTFCFVPLLQAAEPAYKEITWEALVPKGWDPTQDLKVLLNSGKLQDSDPRAMEALEKMKALWDSAPTEPSLAGMRVRLPGFAIPLEAKADKVSEFLLVPYFGACIHVPPPPSNQIVHVKSEVGVKLDELYQPYWIEGAMQVKPSSSELADAGYQMDAQKIYMYELEE